MFVTLLIILIGISTLGDEEMNIKPDSTKDTTTEIATKKEVTTKKEDDTTTEVATKKEEVKAVDTEACIYKHY